MSKKSVAISLSSRHEGDAAGENGEGSLTRQTHLGTLHERDGACYLRYDEEEISTTLKIAGGEIRLYRRGKVDSWQIFSPDDVTGGLLTLGGSEMVLRIHTSALEVVKEPTGGRVLLVYELFTSESNAPDADPMGMSLGRFTLSIDWTLTGFSQTPI